MSGDLQARRKVNKNRSKKKSQLQEMEKREYFEEAQLGFGEENEDTPPPTANKNKRPLKKKSKSAAYNNSETDDSFDNDSIDSQDSQTRESSKVGFLTKFIFFSLLIVFLAMAGLSVGVEDYRAYIKPDALKFWGSDCILPDFQGLQTYLNMASISKTFESLKEKTDHNLIRPLQDGLRFLSNLFEGDRQTEEQIHVNDDSQDYSEELNEWIRSYDPAEVALHQLEQHPQQGDQQKPQPESKIPQKQAQQADKVIPQQQPEPKEQPKQLQQDHVQQADKIVSQHNQQLNPQQPESKGQPQDQVQHIDPQQPELKEQQQQAQEPKDELPQQPLVQPAELSKEQQQQTAAEQPKPVQVPVSQTQVPKQQQPIPEAVEKEDSAQQQHPVNPPAQPEPVSPQKNGESISRTAQSDVKLEPSIDPTQTLKKEVDEPPIIKVTAYTLGEE